ncbi:MAG TPA: hypothetical protein VFM98_12495 [Ramlibacter sp.]|uniref:hypothetical protein n=1 Tax=Ramlibacter sp. TaxID=1917967 RepID=UPI002D808095|nr:hypothetical protein [Ramlibacter sp.]HET8746419.1 hypothetical protein [Ramlibacter sp.]
MADALAASLLHVLLGLELGSTAQGGNNRFSIDGLTLQPQGDGALEIGIRRFDAAALRVALGPLVLEIDRIALHQLALQLQAEAGRLRLRSGQAASAELFGVKVQGPLALPAEVQALPAGAAAAAGPWSLGPLAAADGTIRAEIVDAHLLFDADVTVPIRRGRVDFNEATVEHVGPDSRMGVSRLGVYVDAPNGRSYLYQFTCMPVVGAEFERRGAFLGARVTDRGHLQLQPFAEALLRQPAKGLGMGITDQARQLFDRTALSGDLQLGDGRFGAPGVQAELTGRAERRNAIRVHSEAVGRGISAEMASVSVQNALLDAGALQLACDQVTGALTLHVFVEGGDLRFVSTLANVKIVGLRLQPR